MKSITLDAHSGESQMAVISEEGEILIELRVETTPEELRRVVGGVPGPKRVIFEEGPLSAMIHDALEGVADEIISCDPTRNALIARSENSNDEQDARRLGVLHRAGAIHSVHIPVEPCRTLRSLTHHDQGLAEAVAATKNRIKALCRRNAIPCKGAAAYHTTGRKEATGKLPNGALRWQMESLYRQLDALRRERVRARTMVLKQARKTKVVKRLRTIPGVGPKTGPVIAAWIAEPRRFRNRGALSSYGGLGLKQDVSNWKVLRHAHASRRGNRELKRAVFIAARCALRGTSALRRRYDARREAGWEDRKAIRDVARTILFTACAIWKKGTEYDDARVSVPENDRGAR